MEEQKIQRSWFPVPSSKQNTRSPRRAEWQLLMQRSVEHGREWAFNFLHAVSSRKECPQESTPVWLRGVLSPGRRRGASRVLLGLKSLFL